MTKAAPSVSRLHPPQHPVEKKVEEFRSFLPGWLYGEGDRFEESTIEKVLELNAAAMSAMLYEADVFPGANGEMMLTIYHGDYHLDLVVENAGTVSMTLEQGDNEIDNKEGLSLAKAKEEILNFRRYAWKLSDFSANTIGTRSSIDLGAYPSGIPATTAESQSLLKSVLSIVAKQFVPISMATTPQQPSIHSSTGALIQYSCP